MLILGIVEGTSIGKKGGFWEERLCFTWCYLRRRGFGMGAGDLLGFWLQPYVGVEVEGRGFMTPLPRNKA